MAQRFGLVFWRMGPVPVERSGKCRDEECVLTFPQKTADDPSGCFLRRVSFPPRHTGRFTQPFGGRVPDLTVAAIVVYVQLGIFTLGYVVYRRLAALHGELARERCRNEAAAQNLDSLLNAVTERVGVLERHTRNSRPGSRLQLGKLDLRTRAMEMADQGASSGEIASALRLRRPEAELLVKLQKLRGNVGDKTIAVVH